MLGSDRPKRRATIAGCTAGLLVASLALWGLTGGDGEPGPDDASSEPSEVLQPVLASPAEPTTIVEGDGAADLAAATSALLFDEAPVVVVAPEDDVAAQARAASAAVALGVPLLLAPPVVADAVPEGRTGAPAGQPPEMVALSDELARLAPRSVLAFGTPDATWFEADGGDVAVVAVSDEVDGAPWVAELDLDDQRAAPQDELLAAVAALPREHPPLLTLDAEPPTGAAAEQSDDSGDGGDSETETETDSDSATGAIATASIDDLPAMRQADPLDDVVVLVEHGDDAALAAAATARASGAEVVPVEGTDPRADAELIAALAEQPLAEQVVALGDDFGPAERLRQRLDVAATGVELPGGGQVLFPGRRMIALYGHPGAPVLGVLGEQPVDAAVARAQQMAADYDDLVDEPVVPAFEIITTVASAAPGPDGQYSSASTVDELRPWVDAAAEAGVYVVLDLQPGRNDFLAQAQLYEELLVEPHVGLALDPEWRLAPDQVHMAQIGSVGADEVNAVADWLAELTREHQLPQKLLLLHQFQLRMIGDRGQVDTTHDELAVLVHADGFGTPGQKMDTWNALRGDPLPDAWWGWKNFIDEDQPTFTPAETVAVEPTPWFVSYQ